jgi:hypothetical protein
MFRHCGNSHLGMPNSGMGYHSIKARGLPEGIDFAAKAAGSPKA